jgi:hypothetical protein
MTEILPEVSLGAAESAKFVNMLCGGSWHFWYWRAVR